jgi:hypothetical protein
MSATLNPARKTTDLGRIASCSRWIVMTLGVGGLLPGCTLNDIIDGAAHNCLDPSQRDVQMPSGGYSPASYIRLVLWDGERLFTGEFPHGAVDPTKENPPQVPNGEPIPSTRLAVDRKEGVIVRSYLDTEGRLVEERWRIRGEAP